MAFRSPNLAKSLRYSFFTGTAVCGVAAYGLNRRLALEDEKMANQTANYHQRRTTSSLLSSLFVYTISSSPLLVALGKASISICDAIGAPMLYSAIARNTFYTQFCGGETCKQVQTTMRALRQDKMGVILAYAKEEAAATEEAFERVKADTVETISVACSLPNNFVALKLTALADPGAMKRHTEYLRASGESGKTTSSMIAEDQRQIENLRRRLHQIMDNAVIRGVKILIDAEQDRYQGSIEALSMEVFRKYNRREAWAYGTYQCYLKHTLGRLQDDLALARKEGWTLGAKLVRGAYIASDPRHLIHDTKADTDNAYNTAIKILLRTKKTETIVASHNEESLNLALSLFPPAGPVAFSQLYGMGAPVTYALLSKLESMPQTDTTKQGGGIRVYSYVPWGTVEESMKYLLRRADENSAMVARGKAERNEIANELVNRILHQARLK